MKIIITQWALDAYLELKHTGVFTSIYYQEQLRSDAMLLAKYPDDPKFDNDKFWSQAKFNNLGMQLTALTTRCSNENGVTRRLNTTYSGTVSQLHTQV